MPLISGPHPSTHLPIYHRSLKIREVPMMPPNSGPHPCTHLLYSQIFAAFGGETIVWISTLTRAHLDDLGCPALGSDLTVCYEILSKSLQRFPEEQIRTEICRLGPPRDILSIFFETYANLMCSNFFVLPQTRFSKIEFRVEQKNWSTSN